MQDYAKALLDLAPAVAAVGAGYGLARWGGLTAAPLQTMLRLLLFPAILFVLLMDRVPLPTFGVLAGIGAGTVLAAAGVIHVVQRYLRRNVYSCAMFPNVACFSIPFLALSWETIGLGTACALYVGAALASVALEKNAASLVRQPWPYAVAAAFAVNASGVLPPQDPVVLRLGESFEQAGPFASIGVPLVMAGLLVLFMLLGVSLHPFRGLGDKNAWITVAVRLVCGLGVGLAAVQFLPMSRAVMEAIIIVSLAPPTTRALRFTQSSAGMDHSEASAANVGMLVSAAAMSALLIVNW